MPWNIQGSDEAASVEGLRTSGAQEFRSATVMNEKPRQWSAELAPTQVQVVDILQFANHLYEGEAPLRIAVVISAWDLIKVRLSPSAWLERRLPLLSQFLRGNERIMPFRVFGVSALGGDLKADLPKLQAEPLPTQRIQVIDDALAISHDLTRPLRFVLHLDL